MHDAVRGLHCLRGISEVRKVSDDRAAPRDRCLPPHERRDRGPAPHQLVCYIASSTACRARDKDARVPHRAISHELVMRRFYETLCSSGLAKALVARVLKIVLCPDVK